MTSNPNNYRLQQALKVLDDFLVIGMTENIMEFMEVLEHLLPNFFRGARMMFQKKGQAKQII